MISVSFAEGALSVSAELSPAEAEALAQFFKRASWTTYENCAVSPAETEQMLEAAGTLRRLLAGIGYDPR